jgi:hypothetical protein
MRPRFKVATVTGYRIVGHESATGSGSTEGITAHILDTHHCHRVVRTIRSESVNRRPPFTKGHGRTLALADAECDRLNRRERRASVRERS